MKIHKPLKNNELAPPASLSQERQEFAAMFLIAYNDIKYCMERIEQDHSDFWKRALFRSFFSFVEFSAFRLRYLLLAGLKDNVLELSPEEILILREQTAELNDTGKVHLKSRFLSFEAYFRFTLNTYAKHFHTGRIPDYGDRGWEAMKRSVVVRNLLTHPRTYQHLFVSEDDLKDLTTAMDWYLNTIRYFVTDWNQGGPVAA